MASFKYLAKTEKGNRVSGILTANDENELQTRLKNEGLYLEKVKGNTEKNYSKKIRSDRLSDFSRNIGQLTGAGVTLVKALKIICDDETVREEERKIYQAVLKQVRAGTGLSEAMGMQGGAFPPMLINMFRSAEASGTLEKTARQMAVYYEKEYRFTGKIKSSLTYPKILCVLMVAVLIIIMGYVVPRFGELFARMAEIPATTRVLLGISSFVVESWYLLILGAVILYIIWKLLRAIYRVRYYADRLKVRFPGIGKLQKVIYTARFARTLAGLYNAGIPILSCLDIAKDTIGNRYIEAQFDEVIKEVCAGRNLSEALSRVDGFSRKMISSIIVGEETGSLDEMLLSIADQLEFESEKALEKLVAMIGPCMIIIMAVLVGFIIVSIIQPIYGSYEALAGSIH